jgi:hypothetical protein
MCCSYDFTEHKFALGLRALPDPELPATGVREGRVEHVDPTIVKVRGVEEVPGPLLGHRKTGVDGRGIVVDVQRIPLPFARIPVGSNRAPPAPTGSATVRGPPSDFVESLSHEGQQIIAALDELWSRAWK